MGAWGVGAFDNDDAADWVAELEEAATIEPVVTALRTATADGYLEAPDCCIALAAAETVAAALGRAAVGVPDKVARWASTHRPQVSDDLIQLAQSAIRRIETQSELQELWQESDELEAWVATIKDLERRLRVT